MTINEMIELAIKNAVYINHNVYIHDYVNEMKINEYNDNEWLEYVRTCKDDISKIEVCKAILDGHTGDIEYIKIDFDRSTIMID